jgi:hypothetical protein
MPLKVAIVGLPNVGKSTLFNALTETAQAQAANYPFCTIEPNVGEVAVPEPRLARLAAIAASAAIVPARITFVDVAGLVRGAAQGEGLGNQFLSHIRDCDAIALVARCFEDSDVTHVEGRIDPLADVDIIATELMLADLDSLERRLPALEKRAKGGDKEAVQSLDLARRAQVELAAGRPARAARISAEEERPWRMLQLLTAKPALYVANVEEASAAHGNALSAKLAGRAAAEGAKAVAISARIESEIALLERDERAEFLGSLGLAEPGLDRLIHEAYALLGLHTFFTAGPKETRAWTIPVGASAPQAAGVIHSDFERKFIRAETIAYADYVSLGGEAGARAAGKLRAEGRDYTVRDGDVMNFLHGG